MVSKCPHCGHKVLAMAVYNQPEFIDGQWFWMLCENCLDRWYDRVDWTQRVVEYIGADKLNQIGYREDY